MQYFTGIINGQISRTITITDDADIADYLQTDETVISGSYSPNRYVLENGQPVSAIRTFTVLSATNVLHQITCHINEIDQQLQAGETYVEGEYSGLTHRVENGAVVEIPENEKPTLPKRPAPDVLVDALASQVSAAGLPTVATLPPASAWTKTDAKNAIDLAAGRARFRQVSDGTLINDEYQLTINQVKAWRDASSPSGAVPATISSWATAANLSAELAAQSIETTASTYETALETIRDTRLMGKAAVDAETGDFVAVANTYIATLDAI
jgi:hypothetical protein